MCTREIEGKPVEFGTAGYTMNDIFVLYDRTSDSLWYPTSDTQLEAVSGELRGAAIQIQEEPAPIELGAWLELHPNSTILLPTAEDLARMERRRNRPYMGVQLGEDGDGLLVGSVRKDGPAHQAGLMGGDRLVSIAGMATDSRSELGEVLSEFSVGDTVEVVVDREGEARTLSLTFGRRE